MVPERCVQTSAKFVVDSTEHVKINISKVYETSEMLSRMIEEDNYDFKVWKQHPLNPKTLNEDTVNWIFVCDLLNFSFWSDDEQERYTVKYGDEYYSGYWGLCAALNKARDKGMSLHDFNVASWVNYDQFRTLLAADKGPEIPLIEERFKVFKDSAAALLAKYNGQFSHFIKKAEGNVYSFLSQLIADFPSFKDRFEYKGKQIFMLKRAQILIADLWACFEGQSFGYFHNIDELTMFADYRIPQILYHWGILEYSTKLMDKLRHREVLASGSNMEIEIRGSSIHALELLKSKMTLPVNPVILDFYLWDYIDKHREALSSVPYHRCRSVYY